MPEPMRAISLSVTTLSFILAILVNTSSMLCETKLSVRGYLLFLRATGASPPFTIYSFIRL